MHEKKKIERFKRNINIYILKQERKILTKYFIDSFLSFNVLVFSLVKDQSINNDFNYDFHTLLCLAIFN